MSRPGRPSAASLLVAWRGLRHRAVFANCFAIYFVFGTTTQGRGNGCQYRLAAGAEWLAAIAGSAAASGGVLAGEDWCIYLWRHR
jgi:hypothetical protein